MARVIGTLVSSMKHESLSGYKILWVQPVSDQGIPVDAAFLAIDGAQAGIGDYVLVVQEGKSARAVMESADAPCEAVVVGVIDYLQIGGTQHRLQPPTKG